MPLDRQLLPKLCKLGRYVTITVNQLGVLLNSKTIKAL